jgi:hypothetical protein
MKTTVKITARVFGLFAFAWVILQAPTALAGPDCDQAHSIAAMACATTPSICATEQMEASSVCSTEASQEDNTGNSDAVTPPSTQDAQDSQPSDNVNEASISGVTGAGQAEQTVGVFHVYLATGQDSLSPLESCVQLSSQPFQENGPAGPSYSLHVDATCFVELQWCIDSAIQGNGAPFLDPYGTALCSNMHENHGFTVLRGSVSLAPGKGRDIEENLLRMTIHIVGCVVDGAAYEKHSGGTGMITGEGGHFTTICHPHS